MFPRHVTLLGGLSTHGLGSPLCSGGRGRDAQWGRWSGGGKGSTFRLRGFSSRPRNHLSPALVAQNLGTPGRGDRIFSITVSLSPSSGNEKSAGILNGGHYHIADTCQVIQSLMTQFPNFVSRQNLLSLLARSLSGRVSRVYRYVSSVFQGLSEVLKVFRSFLKVSRSLQCDRVGK